MASSKINDITLTKANLEQHENIINNSEVIEQIKYKPTINILADNSDGLQQPTTVTSNAYSAEDKQFLNMTKKLNVFRKHHKEIRKLEKLNEKHGRLTNYDVRDEHVAKKAKENASKVSKDHRLLSLVQTCERLFNEEKKMCGHGDNFWEWSKWVLRKGVVHISKTFISCVAVYNSELDHKHEHDNHRMVKILQHIEEVGELLLLSIMIRYRPDEMKACKLDKNLMKQGYDLCEFTHLIHKTCTMQAGQTRTRKLHSQARRFCKMILQFQSDFNNWDKAQAFKMFNLIRHVIQSGSLPFQVAPSAGLIRAVKEEKKIAAGSKNDPFDEGNDSDEEVDTLGLNGKSSADKKDDVSSKSSWTGTVTESENSESSWASLQRRELRRAHHDTPFIAGGRVYRHPRASRTRGGRPLTRMELETIPLVTGAREAPEPGTFMDSPKRMPHHKWKPHQKMKPHRTHGTAYHNSQFGVAHPEHHGDHDENPNIRGKDDFFYDDGESVQGHKHHHHHKHQEKRARPPSLRECIQNHILDHKTLREAYLMRKVVVPESWKEKQAVHKHTAEGILKRAQAVHIHEHQQHNVYKVEDHERKKRHARPKTAHSARAVLEYAKQREKNVPIVDLDNMAYRHSMATQITVNRKKTSMSNYSFDVNRFNTNTKATFETTKMGQKEIYQKLMPRSNMIDDEGNVRPVSPRLAKDTREGYKIVREMQHKAKAESVSHRGRHTQKGHFQTIPFVPVRPETTKRPKTTNVTTRRNIVEPQSQEQQQRAMPSNKDNKGNNSQHSRRPKTSMGNNNNNSRKVRPQTAVGSYNIDNSSTMHNTYSIRSKSVIGHNTCLNMDTILKKARPQSSIATRHMVNVTGNYKAITTAAKNSSQNNKANKCSTTTNLGSSSSAYFNDMDKFEKILDKKEKRDQIKKQMKSWRTKTKAHARKRKNQLIAEQMYKSGNMAEARKAKSQNIKANRLRKFTPFSF